jgi:hypothetical protein
MSLATTGQDNVSIILKNGDTLLAFVAEYGMRQECVGALQVPHRDAGEYLATAKRRLHHCKSESAAPVHPARERKAGRS